MFGFASWLARKPPPEIGCVAQVYVDRTEQAQKDLLAILEYLAERTYGEEAKDEEMERAARLCGLPQLAANISLIGLAFVIGYNVEVMFWLFDQMFSAMGEKRAKEERERACIQEQTAGAGRAPPPAGASA